MLNRLNLSAIVTACLVAPSLIPAAAESPRIFYSDLVSGPDVGGEQNLGAIVTITGNGFGPAQRDSQLQFAGASVKRILMWTDSRISFQIGPGAQKGALKITSSHGASNSVPFAVT